MGHAPNRRAGSQQSCSADWMAWNRISASHGYRQGAVVLVGWKRLQHPLWVCSAILVREVAAAVSAAG